MNVLKAIGASSDENFLNSRRNAVRKIDPELESMDCMTSENGSTSFDSSSFEKVARKKMKMKNECAFDGSRIGWNKNSKSTFVP